MVEVIVCVSGMQNLTREAQVKSKKIYTTQIYTDLHSIQGEKNSFFLNATKELGANCPCFNFSGEVLHSFNHHAGLNHQSGCGDGRCCGGEACCG